jgi:hypothetical protein
MKSHYVRIAFAGFMLALGVVSVQMFVPSTAYAQSSNSAAMTNADVVKLAKLGFSSEIIKEKISGASTVNFKVEVDDLVKLKNAGVSQDVISAMLQRADGGGRSSASAAAGAAGPAGYYPGGPAVTLVTKDGGSVNLRSISGTMSSTNAVVTVLIHENYPGMAAAVRTHDTRPSFIVTSAVQPKGSIYIVSLDVDKGDQDRSLKLGNSRFWGGMKNMGAPDKDNQVAYDAVSMGSGNQWKLTPTNDLKPGEYGLYSAGLYDFGVDN